jgi:hypothetical protein
VAAPASPELDELEHVDAAERGRGGFPNASLGLPKRPEFSNTRALGLSLGLPHIRAGELESRVAPGTGGGGSGGLVLGGGTRGAPQASVSYMCNNVGTKSVALDPPAT